MLAEGIDQGLEEADEAFHGYADRVRAWRRQGAACRMGDAASRIIRAAASRLKRSEVAGGGTGQASKRRTTRGKALSAAMRMTIE
jgi:hypothetical protein